MQIDIIPFRIIEIHDDEMLCDCISNIKYPNKYITLDDAELETRTFPKSFFDGLDIDIKQPFALEVKQGGSMMQWTMMKDERYTSWASDVIENINEQFEEKFKSFEGKKLTDD